MKPLILALSLSSVLGGVADAEIVTASPRCIVTVGDFPKDGAPDHSFADAFFVENNPITEYRAVVILTLPAGLEPEGVESAFLKLEALGGSIPPGQTHHVELRGGGIDNTAACDLLTWDIGHLLSALDLPPVAPPVPVDVTEFVRSVIRSSGQLMTSIAFNLRIVGPTGGITFNQSNLLTLQIRSAPPVLPVLVDIKPGSCRNTIDTRGRDVLPVAILGSAELDVTEIDPASVRLEGVSPLRSVIKDVEGPADPGAPAVDCNCDFTGPDGIPDLKLQFSAQALVNALGRVRHREHRVLKLTGLLRNGAQIAGEDVVVVVDR